MNFFDEKIEKIDRRELKELQLERLKHTVKLAYENVKMYRDRFDAIGLKPEHIRTLKDIEKIPYTTKDDLRENYPYGLFAVPMKKIVRLHASSGTTGKPIVGGYTKNDLDNWAISMARLDVAGGMTEDDIVQNSFGYGLFTGALGQHYAVEKIGATIVPISSGNTERQLMLMRDFGVTAMIATPSYAMYLAEMAIKNDMVKDLKLRIAVLGAEASTREMHDQLHNMLGVLSTQNYGLTELGGPGVSGECAERDGMHINEDMFYPEVVNFEENRVLPIGEDGELVLTTLVKEAMPILRYRTKDICHLIDEPCKCGRTLSRMSLVTGRTDDMLIIKGVNLFPSQIETVLMEEKDIGKSYEIVVDRVGYMDTIEVLVEVASPDLLTDYYKLEDLEKRLRARLRVVTQLDIKVKLVEPFSLKRFEGKAKRVTDKRSKL